jgi:hypothetical protein
MRKKDYKTLRTAAWSATKNATRGWRVGTKAISLHKKQDIAADVLMDWVEEHGGQPPLEGHPTLAGAMQRVSSDKGTFAKYRRDASKEVPGEEVLPFSPSTVADTELLTLREHGGEYLDSLQRGSREDRFRVVFFKLHLGICPPDWPRCPKQLTQKVQPDRWGRTGKLIPQAERDLVRYHGLGQQGAGMACPTCGRIAKYVDIKGLTQRGLAMVMDMMLRDFYDSTL